MSAMRWFGLMGKRSERNERPAVPVERIADRIVLLRGHKVLMDADLAALYGVETRTLNQAVKRNRERFPADFMFQLSLQELGAWRSHLVTSNPGAKMGLRRAPYALTEHGALIRLRQLLATRKDLARRLAEHEKKLASHDQAIGSLMNTIRSLLAPPAQARRRPIGFVTPKD